MPRSRTVTSEMIAFGASMRRVRLSRGWSLAALARAIGMTPNHLGLVEAGENDTTLTTIVAVCRTLDADIRDLMGDALAAHVPLDSAKR